MHSPRSARHVGGRPGRLPPAVREALRAEEARIAGLGDPVDIVRAVGEHFAAVDTELERTRKIRLAAVGQLRLAGWSYDRIAQATGLSKGRVQQLSNEAKTGMR